MILMNDFRARPLALRRQVLDAVESLMDTGNFILGDSVDRFEQMWAKACGVSCGVGVANGMDALEIVLRSLGIGAGDEVITTPVTAFATVNAIFRCGATPVFVDIDPESGLMCKDRVVEALTEETKAVILVHLYGYLKDMPEWVEICSSAGVYLIEDCAQSHLASSDGITAGGWGIAGAYSFYPTKNLGGLGDAGMVVTNDGELAGIAKALRNYGQTKQYEHSYIGLNSRLDEIQAGILEVHFHVLQADTERRKAIARTYRDNIRNENIKLLEKPLEESSHVYHLFVVLSGYRDALRDHLLKNRIQTGVHYPKPMHLQKASLDSTSINVALPDSERHCGECLSIPCSPHLTDNEVEKVVAALNSFRH